MKTASTLPVLLVACLLVAPAHAQKEDEAAKLQSYSVDNRRGVIEQEKVTIERPKFDTSFKIEAAKPNISGLQIAKPKLEILAGPSAGAQTSEDPVKTASAGSAAAATGTPGQSRAVRPLRMDPPEYPREALRRREQGHVVVEFTINPQGTTEDINIVESEPRGSFDSEARRAVARWTFEPALQDGRPVAQRIRHTLEFTLEN